MFPSNHWFHLPSNYVFCQSAAIILLIFLTDIASSNKNNFNSVHHRTKEAETKVNELYCYSCDMLDGDECLNINQTRGRKDLSKKCEQEESFCSVKRFSYTMSDKNSTSDKKLWTLQRNCTKKCENECIIIGERLKIHACETCCQSNLCNVGSYAMSIQFEKNIKIFSLIAMSYFTFAEIFGPFNVLRNLLFPLDLL